MESELWGCFMMKKSPIFQKEKGLWLDVAVSHGERATPISRQFVVCMSDVTLFWKHKRLHKYVLGHVENELHLFLCWTSAIPAPAGLYQTRAERGSSSRKQEKGPVSPCISAWFFQKISFWYEL